MTMKRAAAYVRVSSEDQADGWSLDGQEKALREYGERNGYKVVQVYQDDMSGSKAARPGLDRMLMDAHAGLFQAILVYHTSRLFRNVALARRYKDLLRNKLNIDVIFINQPVFEPNDPNGFMMEGVSELFDEYYLYQLRFWTSLGKKTRAQKGMWNGTLPFGYVTDEETGEPVPHPKNSKGLVMAFEAYATGNYTDRKIADLLNQEGYTTTGNWGERPFTKDTVNRMLKNEFYLGFVKYKGELYPGKHPALISQELFDKCQEVRNSHRKRSRAVGVRRHVYVLASLARCNRCGLTLRCGATSSGKKTRYYRHMARLRGYECEVPDQGIRADDLEAEWAQLMTSIALPDDWRNRIEKLVSDADEREAILRERKVVEEKLRRLKRLYRDLLVDDAEYKSSLNELQTRLSALVLPSSPHLIEAGEYLENMVLLWNRATQNERMEISRTLVKAVMVDVESGKIVAIEPHSVFRLLFTEVCEKLSISII